MERAAAEVARAEAEVTELQAYLARMRDLDAQWRARTADYADTFKKNLETDIDGARQELDYITERLALERAVAERKQTLARQGNTSQPTPTKLWPKCWNSSACAPNLRR
jgi:hypothetical protein